MDNYIFEIEYFNVPKNGQIVAGDTFLINRTKDKRIIATLADGLGSGIKANVLSQMTASMAQNFMEADFDHLQMAQTIIETLPVCSVRKLSYSTYTCINILPDGTVNILEYDNPDLLLLRNNKFIEIDKKEYTLTTGNTRDKMFYSNLKLKPNDRIIFFSDGVTQSGIGKKLYPFGWGMSNVKSYISRVITKNPDLSARKLSQLIVQKALQNDLHKSQDDITCAVVYYRKARSLLLLTGPPSDKAKDTYIVNIYKNFTGKRVISGGTTSKIISNALNEEIEVDLSDLDLEIPPIAKMKSADLITEGMITMNKVIKLLKSDYFDPSLRNNGAYRMTNMLLNSDIIYCLIGTAINPAHQNPNMPIEMGLRRIAVNEITKILREKYIKEVRIEYV